MQRPRPDRWKRTSMPTACRSSPIPAENARCLLGRAGAWIAPIVTDPAPPSPLRWAVADWRDDAMAATGVRPEWWTAPGRAPAIVLAGVAGQSSLLAELVERKSVRLQVRPGIDDAFAITVAHDPWPEVAAAVVVVGANARATMHALHQLSEIVLGSDPLQGWTGMTPAGCVEPAWHGPDVVRPSPNVRWRGFFINDEDALLSWRGGPEDGIVAPEVQRMIIRTLGRLGGNMLAPPMWAGYMDDGSRREMAERGIYYTASHLEVLLTNPQRYWAPWCREKLGKDLPYSFTRHPNELEAFWRESVLRHRDHPVIWPVGLRGAADCPFWTSDPGAPSGMPERARVVSEAVRRQVAILHDLLPSGTDIITTLTMRDEVLELFETGELELPDETLLVWDDLARRAVIRALPDERLAGRAGGNGVYYHLAFCQNPRMQYVPPALIHGELHRAWAAQAGDYLLLNVGNLREVCLQAQLAMELAIAPHTETADAAWPSAAMERILGARFGEEAAAALAVFYDDFTRTEYDNRVSQVAECVAPLVTARELYDIWDPVSAIDWVGQRGDPRALREFAGRIRFDHIPARCWCFDPERLGPQRHVWDQLFARIERLADQVPAEALPFLRENLRLQVQTSRLFNIWADGVIKGFRSCAAGNFAAAERRFSEAAEALETLEREREQVAAGEAGNWFRGEYHHMFRKSLWTLKPRWHAEDTRRLAALARQAQSAEGGP